MANSSNNTLQRTAAKEIEAFLEGEAHKALLVTGARQVTFLFLPGTQFDFDSFTFI